MKNILIIGDSWAIVPCNSYASQSFFHKTLSIRDKNILNWMDFRLLALKHNVNNRSFGGNQNWFQLGIAETHIQSSLQNNFRIDLIIWYHTELCRDLNLDTNIINNHHIKKLKEEGLEGTLDYIAEETYNYATQLHKLSPNTKWAIIGGHAPLRPNKKHILNWANFRLDDYRSKILNRTDIPECQTLSVHTAQWDIMKDKCGVSTEVILKELDKKEIIYSACTDIEKFYDKIHPSAFSNFILTDLIIKHFELDINSSI